LFIVSLVLIACAGALCSYLAWRSEIISASPSFQWGGLALCIVLLIVMRLSVRIRSPGEGVFTAVSIPVAVLFWTPFLAYFLANRVFRTVRALLSLDQIKVRPGYSHAEAAVARNELVKALRLYRTGALEHHQPDDAIRAFREAQDRQPDPENKLLLAFAIAETLADAKGAPAAAMRVLEDFLKEHPAVDGKQYAEERIAGLRSRLAGS
jgi:hypothetical protein